MSFPSVTGLIYQNDRQLGTSLEWGFHLFKSSFSDTLDLFLEIFQAQLIVNLEQVHRPSRILYKILYRL